MNAYIYDAVRTPRAKGKKDGSLHEVTPVKLSVSLLEALRQRNNLDTSLIEDIILGCVTQIGEQGGEIAKTISMAAGYDEKVAGVTVNRFCGSGLEAINQAAAYLSTGQSQLLMAGGVESMSRVAMGSDGGAWYMDPSVSLPTYFVPQGIAADLLATKYGYTRQDVDQWAVRSHTKAADARAQGYFLKSIIPIRDINGSILLQQDETIRPDTSMDALAKLDPAFLQYGQMAGFDSVAIQKYPDIETIHHIHHAGNSSGIVDGAGMVLIGTQEIGEKLGIKPRANIRSFAVVGSEPTIMLTGPIPATELALKRAKLQVSDIDLFEINEAFAAVVLRYIDALKINPEQVNVNGGAIAMGHPLGATGAILLNTIIDELERRDKQFGLISLCIGGGMGIATIVERM